MNKDRFVKIPRGHPKIVIDKNRRRDGRYAVHQAPGLPDNRVNLNPSERALRILLPPGVGDIHWVFLRLRGLLHSTGNAEKRPQIWICSGDQKYDRSADFIKMVPWVQFQGYHNIRGREMQRFANASFFHGKILTTVPGFDLFLAVNKHVEIGMQFDKILPQAGATDWDYPLNLTMDEVEAPTNFILATFYRASFYEQWWKERPPALVLKAVGDALSRAHPDMKIVLVGAHWDEPVLKDLSQVHPSIVNLVGKTTFPQLMWLKKRAKAFFGHPSGSGMLAQHLRCPTLLLWGRWWQFSPGMWTNWARPDMLEKKLYRAMSIDEPPELVAQNLLEMLEANRG